MSLLSIFDKIIDKLHLSMFNFNTQKKSSPINKTRIKNKNIGPTETNINNIDAHVSGSTLSSNNTNISIFKKSDLEPVRITDLVTPNLPELRNKEFLNKEIWGPAVIVPMGSTEIDGCGWDMSGLPAEAAFVTLQDNSIKNGLIQLIDCRFVSCTFKGVAIAAPPEAMTKIRAAFNL